MVLLVFGRRTKPVSLKTSSSSLRWRSSSSDYLELMVFLELILLSVYSWYPLILRVVLLLLGKEPLRHQIC